MTINCEELNEEINELQREFSECLKDDGGDIWARRGVVGLDKRLKEVEGKRDEILEKYMDEFFERHPELLSLSYGEKIGGFKEDILTVQKVADDTIIVMGEKGETKVLKKNGNEKWVYEKNAIFGHFRYGSIGRDSDIFSSQVDLPDGQSPSFVPRVLVMGDNGLIKVFSIDLIDGMWGYDLAIDTGHDINGYSSFTIKTSQRVSEDEIFAMGEGGRIFELKRDPDDGEWLSNGDIVKAGEMFKIISSAKVSEREVFVFGEGGGTRMIRKSDVDGKWRPEEEIKGFFDGKMKGDIMFSYRLSDTEILVSGLEERRVTKENGKEKAVYCIRTRILKKGEDGKWGYDENFATEGFVKGGYTFSSTVEKISEDEFYVFGADGAVGDLRRGEDGRWNFYGGDISGGYRKDEKGEDASMTPSCSIRLSDSKVLMFGSNGETREATFKKDFEALKKNLWKLVGERK